jgi:hypothetical protein
MTNIKFVVRVSHSGTRAPAYVQRFDRLPAQMTTNRKLALLMGRLTAEDAAKAIETSRCVPELVPVHVKCLGDGAHRAFPGSRPDTCNRGRDWSILTSSKCAVVEY